MRDVTALCSIAFAFAILLEGCLDNEGRPPPAREIYFPTALAASTDPSGNLEYLFVVNSDFDLRYNTGTLHSYDLSVIESLVDSCTEPQQPCEFPVDAEGQGEAYFIDSVRIGAHGNDIAISPDQERLYLVSRSDEELTYVDLGADGSLNCSEADRCTALDRAGSNEDVSLPNQPLGLVVRRRSELNDSLSGDFVLMAHRGRQASLFEILDGQAPVLVDTIDELPSDLVAATWNPQTRRAWMPSISERRIANVGIAVDALTMEDDEVELFDAGSILLEDLDFITGGSGDTRAVAFDPRGLDTHPFAYIVAREPRSLLIADLREREPNVLNIVDIVELGDGASRMALAQVQAEGTDASFNLAFVSCFDSRDLYIIDIDRRRLVAVTRNLSGPFDLIVDPQRRLVYLGDFNNSVIRIVDLTPLLSCLVDNYVGDNTSTKFEERECAPTTRALLGTPQPIQELR
ncbi:MAG: hypothetical protein AAF355_09325 [Myxococcota bacterium]